MNWMPIRRRNDLVSLRSVYSLHCSIPDVGLLDVSGETWPLNP